MQNEEKKRGKYICFEGGDGSGKSTLAAAVLERLNAGKKIASPIRFPSDGPVGTLIRQGLMGKAMLESKSFLYLFAGDGLDRQLWIQDELEEQGRHVICDRHPTLSGRAFQPRHHEATEIEDVYNAATRDGVWMPDYLFVVEVSPEEALRRMKGRDKYVDVVFESDQVKDIAVIQERYREVAIRFGGITIDGHRPIRELVDEVLYMTGLA